MYPFERAATFAQDIKKVQTDSDLSALDHCRIVLSEIGNIIGLTRMIRAAKRKVYSDEMPYTCSPADQGASSFDYLSKDESDPDLVRAFVNVFRGVVKKSESEHLFMGCFYCIIPALCLNFVETSIQGKEMMRKQNITRDGYYVDDGLAVGLAFALSVFEQSKLYGRYVFLLSLPRSQRLVI